MTIEEAIKILDNCRIKADCARDETLPVEAEKEREDYIEACTMAIEALRKQIPKKVKFEDGVFLGTPCKDPYCPSCGDNFNGGEWWYLNCCPECGQALDWSE